MTDKKSTNKATTSRPASRPATKSSSRPAPTSIVLKTVNRKMFAKLVRKVMCHFRKLLKIVPAMCREKSLSIMSLEHLPAAHPMM